MLGVATFLALFAAADSPSEALRLATAEASERITLPPGLGDIDVDVRPLEKKIRLKVGPLAPTVAARITAQAGTICPEVSTTGVMVELACSTMRLDAAVTRDKGVTYLDLQALRGLPWRPGVDGPPLVSYTGVFPDESCPGTSFAMRGECALLAGKWVDAAKNYRRALGGRDKILAALRLGDLAFVAAEPMTALIWYERAGKLGAFGRMASARLCELEAECFVGRPKLDPDPTHLPRPLWADLTLRRVRVEAFAGRPEVAVKVLGDSFDAGAANVLCDGVGASTCRRALGVALRTVRGADALRALQVFLDMPRWDRGPLSVETAQAAAEAAARLDAPSFAANVMSAVAGAVSDQDIGDHLARTAELYLEGHDVARARLIIDFAQTRLGPKALATGRWPAIHHALVAEEHRPAPTEKHEAEADEGPAKDLAAALGAIADAHALGKDPPKPTATEDEQGNSKDLTRGKP